MAATAQTNLTTAATTVTNGLRDIKPPIEIPSGWEWLWWVLGATVVLGIILGLMLFLIMRRKQVGTPRPIPAHVRAKEQLEEALKLLSQPKPFVVAVSDTLRGYLEERFSFHAPERTTEEFLHEMQATPLLERRQKESLGDFLQRCDLVKFAKYEPTEAELRHLHTAAYHLVEETEPHEPAVGKDIKPPADSEPPEAPVDRKSEIVNPQ